MFLSLNKRLRLDTHKSLQVIVEPSKDISRLVVGRKIKYLLNLHSLVTLLDIPLQSKTTALSWILIYNVEKGDVLLYVYY